MNSIALAADIRVGPAQVSGPLTVYPLFGGEDPRLEYRSFAQAAAEGFVVHELAGGASVNDLVVTNPLDVAVLLYDGQEVLGAQQNRTLDLTVLVPAGAHLTVPVSCVEAGRWDGSRHKEGFVPAPQAAYPSMRRMKAQQSTRAAAAGREARADQSAVWAEVGAKAERRGAHSDTGAMHDLFEHDRPRLDAIAAGVARQDGQVGAVAVIGGQAAVLDYVSRSDVWAALHAPLVQGYALDALDDAGPRVATFVEETVDRDWVRGWCRGLLSVRDVQTRRSVGLGQSFAIDGCDSAAAGCVHDGELIQLSAFPAYREPDVDPSRIRRPSRRR